VGGVVWGGGGGGGGGPPNVIVRGGSGPDGLLCGGEAAACRWCMQLCSARKVPGARGRFGPSPRRPREVRSEVLLEASISMREWVETG
jgi:hypothetical protein